MSELQPGILKDNTDGVKTLGEAFGFSLFDLHVVNEDGREVSEHIRERVIHDILGEDTLSSQASQPQGLLEKVSKIRGSRLYQLFFGDKGAS